MAGRPEFGLRSGLRAPREPSAGRGNAAQPDATLPGAPAHVGAGERGEHNHKLTGFHLQDEAPVESGTMGPPL